MKYINIIRQTALALFTAFSLTGLAMEEPSAPSRSKSTNTTTQKSTGTKAGQGVGLKAIPKPPKQPRPPQEPARTQAPAKTSKPASSASKPKDTKPKREVATDSTHNSRSTGAAPTYTAPPRMVVVDDENTYSSPSGRYKMKFSENFHKVAFNGKRFTIDLPEASNFELYDAYVTDGGEAFFIISFKDINKSQSKVYCRISGSTIDITDDESGYRGKKKSLR